MRTQVKSVLTLLLVLGAVTCSPVPSDPPALPNAAHIEVTHEVRQVTFEVSEEVNEATESSHIPSDVPPEEDPPIPTVTTPQTAPEGYPQNDDSTSKDVSVPLHEASSEQMLLEVSPEHVVTDGEPHAEETKAKENISEVTPEEEDLTNSEIEQSQVKSFSDSDIVHKTSEELSLESVESVPESQTFDFSDDADISQQEEVGLRNVVELAPESHIFDSSEEANASQNEESTESLEANSSIINPVAEEPTLSVSPTDVTLPLDAVEEETGVLHEEVKPEENTEELLPETASDIISRENIHEVSQLTEQTDDSVSEESSNVSEGEELEEVPAQVFPDDAISEFLETNKRTDDEDMPVHGDFDQESQPESSGEGPADAESEESFPEATRESRVYIDYEETAKLDADGETTMLEHEAVPSNSGLESMSMTSPTPESLPEDFPIVDDLEKEEAPPAENQEEETPTVIPDMDSQEENSTLITDVHQEPDYVPEVVINPPSSTVTPLPIDEYTDHYSDPLDFGNLPDFDVTHEKLPSSDDHLPKEAEFIPEQTHDLTGEVNESESSDLAAGDHTLEVEAGSPRVLPPQQEQVSAAAPSSLTPGCIVAIVFGVLVSLVVILGVGGFMIWQRRTQNRPKVLGNDQGYAGSDSGGYIDDQVRVSYVNSQTDTPKGQTTTQASQGAAPGPQVFIRLKSLKPSMPIGAAGIMKSLPNMPKITPMNMPNLSQIISKRESGGSNKPGQ